MDIFEFTVLMWFGFCFVISVMILAQRTTQQTHYQIREIIKQLVKKECIKDEH